jgi:hypothetical protein
MTRERGRQGCMRASPAAELEPEHNRKCCPALKLFCITITDATHSRPRFEYENSV